MKINKTDSLLERLSKYNKTDYYGFHMPGHKRNSDIFNNSLPYDLDITEIEEFDDLHHCEGILLESQKRASKLFKSKETFYLINGSTVGNLAAIFSVTNRGDKIVVARNNHKSVYNAVFLNGLNPIYIYPQFDEDKGISGEIQIKDLEKVLIKEKDIKAIVIVSPTYDGVVSDIKGISSLAHEYEIPLIVDEAHGAHFSMHSYFPRNSNELGADIVVQSVHKTLLSLTQTGVIHVNGNRVDREQLYRYLKMFQSSSPSYILMSSIDTCVDLLLYDGEKFFKQYVKLLEDTRSKLKKLKKLTLLEVDNYDKSKILISTKNTSVSSKELYNLLLEKYHLQMEMCGADYVTAMTSIGDTEEGLKRLVDALFEIEEKIEVVANHKHNVKWELPRLEQALEGRKGSEWFYYLYPPGIPLVVPGEEITEEVRNWINEYKKLGFIIQKG